jgi:hypothetical protein
MLKFCISAIALLLLTGSAVADEEQPMEWCWSPENNRSGLWKVSSGDHVLWILGGCAAPDKVMAVEKFEACSGKRKCCSTSPCHVPPATGCCGGQGAQLPRRADT